MTLREQLEREKNNNNLVFLSPEGLFYKAYERSAFILCTQYQALKPSCKYVKYLNGAGIISVGFPQSSLSKVEEVLERCPMRENGSDGPVFFAKTLISEQDYILWKDEQFRIYPKEQISLSETSEKSEDDELRSAILHYPLESKTPLECMMFLVQLKQMAGKAE